MASDRFLAPADVVASGELFAPVGGNLQLCFQTFGNPDDDALLLVMGLGGPMNWWDTQLCRQLAAAGFFVVRYDNRDTGRSSRIPVRVRRSQLIRAFAGASTAVPYSISDLAGDAVALLDHLGVDSAHLVGASMGGMIAQTVAIEHGPRVKSLTSIMSTTGRRTVGWTQPTLIPKLMTPRKPGRDDYIAFSAAFWQVIGSPSYPVAQKSLHTRAGETFDRGVSASGVMRHMLAVLTQPDRTPSLHTLRVPTLVLHGMADKMVHVSGGRSTAAAVPGAELMLIDGMGHDMPPDLFDTYVEAIRRTADRAS